MIRIKSIDPIIYSFVGFFIIGYLVKVEMINSKTSLISYLPFLVLVLGFIYSLFRALKYQSYYPFPKKLNFIYIYIFISFITLVICNLISVNPVFSISRSILSLSILVVSFLFFWQAVNIFDNSRMEKASLLSWSMLVLMILLILGQITIPDWRSGIGGIRMSGGSNPNQLGFFCFFSIIWAHYYSLKISKWYKYNIILYILSFIAIIWSFSRTVLLSWFIAYFLYAFLILISKSFYLLHGKITNISFKKLSIALIILSCIFLIIPFIEDILGIISILQVVENRLASTVGYNSRLEAWNRLWPYFTENPILGKAGWWNSTRLLPTGLVGVAESPHNLYVRLLAEIGILGSFVILFLPIFAALSLLFCSMIYPLRQAQRNLLFYLFSVIFSLFITQFFEDSYLVGVGELNNGIIVLVLAVCIFELLKVKGYVPNKCRINRI